MNTEKLTWYAARSGGIVAWLLLALGLILGLLLSSRVLGRRASPAWLLSIHRFLGGLSVIFTFVHVAAIMLDDFVSFGWTDVLVPWASEWNPGAVAWGIIATYLAIAIELTSFAMRRLPKGVWRGVHWLSAPLFVMATVHGYQAGTDAGRAFIVAIVITCAVLAALTVIRVVMARRQTEPKADPRVLLEEAKARRAKRDAEVADPEPEPAATPAPGLATSWQSEPAVPAVVPDHAAPEPSPAWTDLRPPEPAEPPAPPPAADEPFWVPAEPEPVTASEPDPTAPAFEPMTARAEPIFEPTPPEPGPVFEPTPREPAPVFERTPPEPEPVFEPTPPEPAPVFEPTPAEPAPVFEPTPPEPVFDRPPPADPTPVFEPIPPEPVLDPMPPREPEPVPSAPAFEAAPAPVWEPQSEIVLEPAGAPRPAWTEPDQLAWVTADAGTDPTIRRREGPVPGVWKRTRRDLSDYGVDNN